MRILAALLLLLASAGPVTGQETGGGKASRTPAQRKIDSQLLQEIDRINSADGKSPATAVKVDRKHRALVDLRVAVTPAIQKSVRGLGGTIVSSSARYQSIIAWVPLLKLEELAAEPPVRAIVPAPGAVIH
jgi:hypothetical protein